METYKEFDDFYNLREKESEQLDYKQTIANEDGNTSGRIEETIAAIANTQGGMIIVGIKTNTDNIPIEKTPLDSKKNYSDLLEQKLFSKVYPTPAYKLFRIADPIDSTKCYLVIKVEKSQKAPHILTEDNVIKIRSGSQNKSANLQQIEEMLENRKIKKAESEPGFGGLKSVMKNMNFPAVSIRIWPIYHPQKLLPITKSTRQELFKLKRIYGDSYHVWPDGYEIYTAANNENLFRQKVLTSGAIIHEAQLNNTDPLFLEEILTNVKWAIQLAKETLTKVSYKDLIKIAITIRQIHRKSIAVDYVLAKIPSQTSPPTDWYDINLDEMLLITELPEKELLTKFAMQILPNFYLDTDENQLSQIIDLLP